MESSSSSDSSDWETVAAFVVLDEDERNKRSTRTWVHDINTKREELGEFRRLVQELRNDSKRFHMYFRMTIEQFDYIHELIKSDIYKRNTQLRKAITTEERLAVCLRYVGKNYTLYLIDIDIFKNQNNFLIKPFLKYKKNIKYLCK
ncbi:unnamed protein product [Macrosiphum euphorbiae]|uniref:Uncharacterized protein n=1 Tax=Macrosiphum euphorbiae TaxID=13131 RepID=A0AAV0XY33_9HEMI|nr:unnamed protein product [Macrosiphum euphorbiae]